MLVLARYEGERIVLRLPSGETMTVQVTAIEPHRVKLGIEAPRSVGVDREEVYHRRIATTETLTKLERL